MPHDDDMIDPQAQYKKGGRAPGPRVVEVRGRVRQIVKDRADQYSRREDVSLSWMMNKALDEWLERYD